MIKIFSFSLVVSVLFVVGAPCWGLSFDDLEVDRSSVVWVEGQVMGDMVLGAKAKLIFLFMDRRLCDVARVDRGDLPEWLTWNLQYESAARRGKREFFLLRYEAIKNWEFDPTKIKVGGYKLKMTDVLSRKDMVNVGPLSSGTLATLAFSVPRSFLKPGHSLEIVYGDWATDWIVPRR
ncbi:hypothetical protein [Dethiosulfovibrio peptidovorans]|nr:hypothetical protein [Dethiosulfovibrio peptidovorans]